MHTVGFAGTAKNTGKTTTTLAVLEQTSAARIPVALTSIGYDGENQDQVTGLPKPRFTLEQGTLVATASGCLSAGTAVLQVLEPTGIRTGLGEIQIACIQAPGTVLVAGPNRASDLLALFGRLAALGARLTLVDGALNRLVPLICTDGLVLSTGAAFDTDINVIARHAQALHTLIRQPRRCEIQNAPARILVLTSDGRFTETSLGSLLGDRVQQELDAALQPPVKQLVLPGACDPHRLSPLLPRLQGAEIVFGSPLKLIASGDPLLWAQLFEQFAQLEITVAYLETIPVYFQTVNPFYPRYLFRPGEYEAAYIDKYALLVALKSRLDGVTVLDIKQPPVPDLLALLQLER